MKRKMCIQKMDVAEKEIEGNVGREGGKKVGKRPLFKFLTIY